jgi:NAD-dependent deacetylase
MMPEEIRQAAEWIIESKHMLAFAGAGLSQESGIPTFRGDEGLWKQYLPIIFGNPAGLFSAFVLSPGKFREFVISALQSFVFAEPNEGHKALAELYHAGLLKAVITQNIDDLEERAGVKEVMRLHGNIYRLRCVSCGETRFASRESLIRILEELKQAKTRTDMIEIGKKYAHCEKCAGWARPDIVLFGEKLNQEDYYRAVELARSSDLMLVLGTSGVVYPAAMIPNYARKAGAKIIEINPEQTEVSKFAGLIIKDGSAKVLPEIIEEMKKISPGVFQPRSG